MGTEPQVTPMFKSQENKEESAKDPEKKQPVKMEQK